MAEIEKFWLDKLAETVVYTIAWNIHKLCDGCKGFSDGEHICVKPYSEIFQKCVPDILDIIEGVYLPKALLSTIEYIADNYETNIFKQLTTMHSLENWKQLVEYNIDYIAERIANRPFCPVEY